MGLAGAIALSVCVYLFLFRGTSVARALRRRTRMFPEVARIVGELRHDVFKHRTSALELLKDGQTSVEKLRSTLLLPVPTSEVVTEAYERIVTLGRSHGLTLRRLHREPVFGPLVRDLERAEAALTGSGVRELLLKVDSRLRNVHLDKLSELLAQGPRTRLDAVELQRWISAVEAEFNSGEWTVPALHMSEPVLEFPLDKPALFQIFSNLLRNAEDAVHPLGAARVQVGVTRVTDFTGQTLVRLQVSDNAPQVLSAQSIEKQDPGRGLGIVRETVRAWNGILVLQTESEPYTKAVGAQFPQ
jgi:signal transduction histidine kinase